MTPAQLGMYSGKDAEREAAAESGGNTRICPKTGHTIVSVGSPEEAAAMLQRLQDAKSKG